MAEMRMSPEQRAFARKARKAAQKFYQDPENMRRYQEWKKRRESGEGNNSDRR